MDTQERGRPSGAIEFFCRHLVALHVAYQVYDESGPTGDPRLFTCSGTIIMVRGVFSFLTAGHILKEWDEEIRRGRVRVLNAFLVDVFGPKCVTNEPIPFDFINEPRAHIDDEEGIDFGIIILRPYYARLLAKNGIWAISAKDWRSQEVARFNEYAMLGLPDELNILNAENDYEAFSPLLIPVKRIEQPPSGRETRFPRFVGQLPSDLEIGSIKGMSGGPIFGIIYGSPLKYCVVALQSSWVSESRTIFGCLLSSIGEIIEMVADQLESPRVLR